LSAQVSRSGRACAPRWWAVVLLLIAALPFASIHTGATGPIMTATTVATLIADINVANTNPMQGPYTINLVSNLDFPQLAGDEGAGYARYHSTKRRYRCIPYRLR